jgi:putative ABC transport system permease protein
MWFRRGLSLAVLVLASLVVGGAVTGPLFLRAAGESVLRDTLAQALPNGRIVSDQSSSTVRQQPLAAVESASAARLKGFPTLTRLLDPPVASLELLALAGSPGAGATSSPFAYREDACAHVQMVEGQCPVKPGSVMVSATSAGSQHWTVGAPLLINGKRVAIAGIYAPLDPTGDFWAGGNSYFAAYAGSGKAGDLGNTLDAVFGPLQTVQAQPGNIAAIGSVDRSLDLRSLRLTDVPSLTTQLLGYLEGGGLDTSNGGVLDTSDVTNSAVVSMLAQATGIKDKLLSPVIVVMGQLLLLCWLILFLVTANAAEARGPEVALAKLRGVPAWRTVAFGLLDTLLLVAAAVPIGLGLGYFGVRALADLHLAPGTPVVVTSGAWLAAASAGAGAAVAAVLAGSRTLRRPVVEQWRRATRQARARSWVIDTVVVAASVAALVALVRGGVIGSSGPNVLALVAPGLVVLAAALLGSRVLPGLCRAAYGPTRRRGHLGGFLAVRQLGRRPSTLRLALVLVVAFGLVGFGVDAWSVASGNAHDRAWTEIGAAQVLTVNPAPGQDLAAIVERLDPAGRDATVVSESTDFTGSVPVQLLAVQPDRFAHIAFWRSDYGQVALATLTQRLTQSVAPAVSLSGDGLQVTLDASRLKAQGPPVLVADIAQIGGGRTSTTLGEVRAGRQTLRGPLPCTTQGCRLIGLHLERPGTSFFPMSGRLVLSTLGIHDQGHWHSTAGDLALPNGWRATGGGAKGPAATSGGLRLDMSAALAAQPTWEVNDRPASLPALMTTEVGGLDHVMGLDNSSLVVHPVATGPALPGGFGRVIVVDRTYAVRAAADAPTSATEMVWLTPSAAGTFPAELDKAGVTILSTLSAAEQAALYSRQGPALAILLFLAGAFLGGLLAAGAAVLNLHLTGRRRTYELAAMSAIGVRRRTLLASLCAEQAALLVFGIGVGVVAGLVGAVLALPSVPEFADQPPAPPMLYGLHLVPVLFVVVFAVVVLAAAIAASSVNLLRACRFDQLREAPA